MNLSHIKNKLVEDFRKSAGFTMIELLVVISIIGVLAVAVLSSINPIEQINKGRDTRARSDAAQLIGAIDRYIAIHEEFPWNTANNVGVDPADIETFDAPFALSGADWNGTDDAWTDLLTATAEVKDGFIERQRNIRVENQRLVIAKASGYAANVYVCFMPSSNAFRQEARDLCAAGAKTDLIQTDLAAVPDAPTLCDADQTIPLDTATNYICVP